VISLKFEAIELTDKNNRTFVLRNAEVGDAEELITYLKVTSAESPYLLREPDEIQLTVGEEEKFIQGRIAAEREIMLVATIDEKIVGCCSLMSVGSISRVFHRCSIAIALYQKFCGMGIGKLMMEAVLKTAKRLKYEQAELEVISDNTAAIALYKKLGFQECGCIPNNMKYTDGRYADAYLMVKLL
jgi:RimJ/RimL family protein N-acetyltransferase